MTTRASGCSMVAAANLRWAAPARRAAASDFVGTFEPYGQLRTHLAGYNDTAEVQDNATRVGINFRTRGAVKMFAGTEWGVNLVQSATQFNLSASGTWRLWRRRDRHQSSVHCTAWFRRRRFRTAGPGGHSGSRTAVHYDVTSYTTDRFNVFGGQGTSTYVAGTDGGASGTGLADRVVNYRNTIFKILEVGFQGQFRGPDSNGVGGSLQLTILPGVKIGGAVTHTNWSPTTQNLVRRPGRRCRLCGPWVLASTGGSWSWGSSTLIRSNGDMVQVPIGPVNTPVAFDADGAELYARAGLGPIGLIGGFTYLEPDVTDPLHRSRLQNRVS